MNSRRIQSQLWPTTLRWPHQPQLRLGGRLRAVTSTEGMTADFYPFDTAFIGQVATRIINEV